MSKVSVLIPTHNRADLLKRAIQSVLDQTYTDFELLVIDDRSSDNTEEVVSSFSDQRIVYLKNTENSARTHCRPLNFGLTKATGDFIAYLDDDNEFEPIHLEILVTALKKGYDVAYCDSDIHTPDGNVQPSIAMDFDAQFLLRRNYIDTSNIMHTREMAFNVGGWDEEVTRFTDWNYCVRMMKWGAKFIHVPVTATKYYAHGGDTQSKRTEVRSWYDPSIGLHMFEPTFDPAGCFIFAGYLGENEKETNPKIAFMTKTYGRLDYTKQMYSSLESSTEYPFDWFVFDQGSEDGTVEWLKKLNPKFVKYSPENVGISKADNTLLDEIAKGDYQIVVHVDNDCQFMTGYWLESFVDLWKRNHKLYMSPYPEGLVHNPGGAPRLGYAYIGPYLLEVTQHIGGFCAFIDARAYTDFRWKDKFKHGNQDWEASLSFAKDGYMPCYVPLHRVWHIDTTAGQQKKYKDYFERRKLEKTEQYEL